MCFRCHAREGGNPENKCNIVEIAYILICTGRLTILPFAGVASICLVTLLRYSAGPIEFEGLGFKFKGASGPIIMWLLCYLVMAGTVKLLW